MKKSFKHYIVSIFLILTIAGTIFLGYRYYRFIPNTNGYNASSFILNEDIIKNLEKDNIKQINYMIFNENESKQVDTKTITLYFSSEIRKYTIEKVRLLQDERILPQIVYIEKSNTVDNKIEISLPQYISSFNKAEFTLKNGKIIVLNTGQFYFEKIPINQNNFKENETYDILKFDSSLKETYFYCDYVLKKGIPSTIEIVSGPNFKQVGCIQTVSILKETSNEIVIRYEASIPKEYHEKNNLNNISFETILLQKEINGDRVNIITKLLIPLNHLLRCCY